MKVRNRRELKLESLSKNILKYTTRKEAMLQSGYSESYSEAGVILQTEGYKRVMKPIIEQLEAERQRLIDEAKIKDLSQVQYEGVIRSMDTLTKNIQLLSGKATENTQINISIDNDINEKNSNENSRSNI